MSDRNFPFVPASATDLAIGDLIGVPTHDGRWGCLQVTDLEPGKRTILWAGVLDWSGTEAPNSESTDGCPILDNKMTRVELFTQGGLQVFDNRVVIEHGQRSNRGAGDVGTVHAVSGWKSRLNAASVRAGI